MRIPDVSEQVSSYYIPEGPLKFARDGRGQIVRVHRYGGVSTQDKDDGKSVASSSELRGFLIAGWGIRI